MKDVAHLAAGQRFHLREANQPGRTGTHLPRPVTGHEPIPLPGASPIQQRQLIRAGVRSVEFQHASLRHRRSGGEVEAQLQRLPCVGADDQRVERRDGRLCAGQRRCLRRAGEERDRVRSGATQHNAAAAVQIDALPRLDVIRADDLLVLAPSAVKQNLRAVRRGVDDRLSDVAVAELRAMLRQHDRPIRAAGLFEVDRDDRSLISRRRCGERIRAAVVRREHVTWILRVRRRDVPQRLTARQDVLEGRIREGRELVGRGIEPHDLSNDVASREVFDVRADEIVFAPLAGLPDDIHLAAGSFREDRMMPTHREETV